MFVLSHVQCPRYGFESERAHYLQLGVFGGETTLKLRIDKQNVASRMLVLAL